MVMEILKLAAAFLGGFALCLFALRWYIRQANQQVKANREYQKTEKRLIDALRYSGARIAFYKRFNRTHLATILAYKKREEELREMLCKPLDKAQEDTK